MIAEWTKVREAKYAPLLYDNALERLETLNAKSADQLALAKSVLLWLTYSLRPLMIKELQHAVTIKGKDGMNSAGFGPLKVKERVLSVCGSLATFNAESGLVG